MLIVIVLVVTIAINVVFILDTGYKLRYAPTTSGNQLDEPSG